MISGATLALAHLAILLGLMGAAAVSAYRARHGVRIGRRGGRYRRLTTPEMLRRVERHGTRGKYSPNGL